VRIYRLVLCAGLAFSLLSALSSPARAQNAAEIRDEATGGDTSELPTVSKDLGSLQEGTWEIVSGFHASVANSAPGGHEYVVFDALGPWTIELSSLALANTSSVLVALGKLDTGSSTHLGFKLVDGPDENLFGELPGGRYFLRVTPQANAGQASYVARITVSAPEEQSLTIALSTTEQ
jgi:hypothetical protein